MEMGGRADVWTDGGRDEWMEVWVDGIMDG